MEEKSASGLVDQVKSVRNQSRPFRRVGIELQGCRLRLQRFRSSLCRSSVCKEEVTNDTGRMLPS